MSEGGGLLLALILSSAVPGLLIFLLSERQVALRTALNLAGAALKVVLFVVLLVGVVDGRTYELRVPFLPDLELVLFVDQFGLLFIGLSAILWFLTTIYAIGYLEGSPNRRRFFGFFSLCVSATMGIALAGNLLTMVVFFELLTLTTYPLVAHRGTPESLDGAGRYLIYTLAGGAAALAGAIWLTVAVGPVAFTPGGAPDMAAYGGRTTLVLCFVLLVAGFGVKGALVPLHGWLPAAMVAPAPVSALLHAVAVVKAGVFAITRVVQELYGDTLGEELGVLAPLAVLAAVTIVWGSVRALTQDELKKRLAYSTVSQLSYVVLGVAVTGVTAATGGIVHIVHQGLMKITLFFCAGLYAEALGIHRVSEMDGVGRRMPLTTAAFTIGALGMIGIPPIAGFISKWTLSLGGVEGGSPWVQWVLLSSTLLNAAYFLPILYRAWFKAPSTERASTHPLYEAPATLLVPTLVTAGLAVAVGVFAGWEYSPLQISRQVAELNYFGEPATVPTPGVP